MIESQFFEDRPDGTVIRVRVTPRAKRNQIGEVVQGRLKIRLTAPPVEGKANQALCRFLADKLRIPQSHIQVLAGDHGRNKTILISGLAKDAVAVLIPAQG